MRRRGMAAFLVIAMVTVAVGTPVSGQPRLSGGPSVEYRASMVLQIHEEQPSRAWQFWTGLAATSIGLSMAALDPAEYLAFATYSGIGIGLTIGGTALMAWFDLAPEWSMVRDRTTRGETAPESGTIRSETADD